MLVDVLALHDVGADDNNDEAEVVDAFAGVAVADLEEEEDGAKREWEEVREETVEVNAYETVEVPPSSTFHHNVDDDNDDQGKVVLPLPFWFSAQTDLPTRALVFFAAAAD
jgi:hypothetical protein